MQGRISIFINKKKNSRQKENFDLNNLKIRAHNCLVSQQNHVIIGPLTGDICQCEWEIMAEQIRFFLFLAWGVKCTIIGGSQCEWVNISLIYDV